MNEGLKALKDIENHLDYVDEKYNVEYSSQIETIEKELKALEIIKKYGHFDHYTGELIVNVPTDKEEEYRFMKEVLL